MDLYKVILVDDEEEARKGIINKIQWEEQGFTLVADAENGNDALEKIEALEPHLVITDINMPYMTGLELAKLVQQKYPSIKMILLSGYDQFDYAQEALRYGIIGYILKPVDVTKFNVHLQDAKAKLDQEVEKRRNVAALQEHYIASLPLLREQFLNKLLNNSRYHLTEEEILYKLGRYEIDLGDSSQWMTAVVDIEAEKVSYIGGTSRERELIPISVKKFLADKLGIYFKMAIFSSVLDARIVLIIAVEDEQSTQTYMMDLLRDACREAKRTIGVSITIGVGNAKKTLREMDASYQEAIDAIGYKRVIGIGGLIYIQDVEPVNTGVLKLEEKEINDIISVVKFGPDERMMEVMNGIYDKMRASKVHFRQSQAYMLSIVACIVNIVQQYGINVEAITDYSQILNKIGNVEEFRGWLVQTCKEINGKVLQKRETTTKQIIKEAKEYIADHYHESELSVEMICKHLHMSPAYFSTLFKKEMGQTYVAYLTDLRLNKAVELLNTTDSKTYVIAEKVGYQEQNYFSYVFKKKFGVPPTKYRSLGNQNN